MAGRALHFVFKVAERTKTIKFYRELLGMKVIIFVPFFFLSISKTIDLLIDQFLITYILLGVKT